MSTEIKDKSQVQSAGLRKFNKAEAQVKKVIAALNTITVIATPKELDNAMAVLKTGKEVEKAIEGKRTELVKPLNEEVKRINSYAKTLTAGLVIAIDAGKKVVISYNQEEERKATVMRSENRIQQLLSLGMVFTPAGDDGISSDGYSYNGYCVPKNLVENAADIDWERHYTASLQRIQEMKNKEASSLHAELEEALFFSSEDEVEEIKSKIQEVAESPVIETVSISVPTYSGAKGATKRWTFEVTDDLRVPLEYLMVDEKKIREAIATGVREIAGVRIYQADGLTIR